MKSLSIAAGRLFLMFLVLVPWRSQEIGGNPNGPNPFRWAIQQIAVLRPEGKTYIRHDRKRGTTLSITRRITRRIVRRRCSPLNVLCVTCTGSMEKTI